MNSEVQIRKAEINDAPAVAALLYRSFVEYESRYTPAAFAATALAPERILERLSEGPIWVAIFNGAVVGTVSAVLRREALYIRGMAVDPTVQGKKIGYQLLKCAEAFAAQNGCESLLLSTTPFLTRAIQLYEQYGFRRSDEGPNNLFGTPLFTMVKSLPSELH